MSRYGDLATAIEGFHGVVARRRRTRGLTLRDVHQQTGLSPNTLSRYEQGQPVGTGTLLTLLRWADEPTPDPVMWRDGAACNAAGVDPAWFDHTADPGVDEVREPARMRAVRHVKAAAVCRGCVVRADCVRDGFASAGSGVYGGVLLLDGAPDNGRLGRAS